MKQHTGPGFGDYLHESRTQRDLTIRGLAELAHLPPGTISPIESRRYARPARPVIHSLSAALEIPILVPVITAGYADRDLVDVMLDHVWDGLARLSPSLRYDWWARAGGQYLSLLRDQSHTSADIVAARWSGLWSPPVTSEEWSQMESTGQLPSSLSPLSFLSRVPGSWIWAFVAAVIGNPSPGTTYYNYNGDIIGLAFVMGRLSQKTCASWGAEKDYQQLITAFRTARKPHVSEPDLVRTFRTAVSEINWTVAKPDGQTKNDDQVQEMPDDESSLLLHYRLLSAGQKAAVLRIVRDLSAQK